MVVLAADGVARPLIRSLLTAYRTGSATHRYRRTINSSTPRRRRHLSTAEYLRLVAGRVGRGEQSEFGPDPLPAPPYRTFLLTPRTDDRLVDHSSAYQRIRRHSGQTYGTGRRMSSARTLLRRPSSVDVETIASSPTASVPCSSICSNASPQSGQTFSEGISVSGTRSRLKILVNRSLRHVVRDAAGPGSVSVDPLGDAARRRSRSRPERASWQFQTL